VGGSVFAAKADTASRSGFGQGSPKAWAGRSGPQTEMEGVCGLYLNPPPTWWVCGVDDRSGRRAAQAGRPSIMAPAAGAGKWIGREAGYAEVGERYGQPSNRATEQPSNPGFDGGPRALRRGPARRIGKPFTIAAMAGSRLDTTARQPRTRTFLTIRASPWPVCWVRLAKAANLLHLTISRTRSRRTLRGLAFSDHVDGRAGSVLQLPHPLLVLRHAIPVILESVVAPFAAYYCVLLISGFRGALLSALAWSYFLIGRRFFRHERVSTLLMLGTALLTLRTIVSFVTDSAFVYFIQPTMSAFVASFLLVLTALAGRPFTQRFTHDFCPLTPELLARPSVHRFFIRVSFLWAVTMFLNGAIVLALLLTASARSFPVERLGATLSVTAAAIFFSINWFARSMRRDGVTVSFVGSQALTRLSHD
jgi:hypothetical protein